MPSRGYYCNHLSIPSLCSWPKEVLLLTEACDTESRNQSDNHVEFISHSPPVRQDQYSLCSPVCRLGGSCSRLTVVLSHNCVCVCVVVSQQYDAVLCHLQTSRKVCFLSEWSHPQQKHDLCKVHVVEGSSCKQNASYINIVRDIDRIFENARYATAH